MSIKLLIKEYPYRSIALATTSHALVFRYDPSSESSNGLNSLSSFSSAQDKSSAIPQCMVELSSLSSLDLQEYRPLSHPCRGTLGLINIGGDIFICVVTGSSQVATVRPGERVERIQTVDFHCLTRSDYDRMLENEVNSYNTNYLDEDGYDRDYGFDYSGRQPAQEHPCLAVKKLLCGGTFYYSTEFDLTNRLQNRSIDTSTFDIDNFEPAFLWNSYMIGPLIKFRSSLSDPERKALDSTHILTSAIRGFVETLTIPHSSSFASGKKVGIPATLTLISRLSCRRAGTRFNARGIDDEGSVANFVETETIIWHPSGGAGGNGIGFSYCQTRGSVPVFWEQQTGLLPNQQKITLSRSLEATQPAFDRHFEALNLKYGPIHVVNLLSATKPSEAELSKKFRYHIRASPLNHDPGYTTEHYKSGHGVVGADGGGEGTMLRATEYDFHAETQGRYEAAHAIRHLIERSANGFAYFLMEEHGSSSTTQFNEEPIIVLQQEGIFRTNCLDCLDRTNLVQGIISQIAIEAFLHHRGDSVGPDFWMRHSSLWADNGDALSKIYAGTGALKSSFTRHGKTSLGGLFADARKSATRMYINKFVDGGRQETIDILLGRQLGQEPVSLYDPINDYVQSELNRRAAEFSLSDTIQIYVGTFNVNGRTNGINDDLSPWLCPKFLDSKNQPEIVVIGFQEIVELSPQQIMATDPNRRQLWEKAVLRTLNDNTARVGGDEYILLRSGQLVGAALLIYVKTSAIKHIRNVEGNIKKTGMSGVAGNKGAVAIRMDYANTKLCFVTAHLAAGFANYEERNRDYRTISHGLRFQRGLTIDGHDSVIWLGDFNYRIGLPDEKVRKLIEIGDLQTLYENDQLNLQMIAGLSFPYYSEASLTFDPTYKFDVGKDIYDTSEKARIPAWCDRVLRKGTNLRQLSYDSAPLRFSDHRPVYATFQCTISIVNEKRKEKLSREIYARKRNESGTFLPSKNESDEEEDLLVDEPIAPGLPPASSDREKWWLENGYLAKSSIKPPGPEYILNPERPSNPFNATQKPDWVKKGELQKSLLDDQTYTFQNPPKAATSSTHSLPPPITPSRRNTSTVGAVAATRRLPPAYDPSTLPVLPLQKAATTGPSKMTSHPLTTQPSARASSLHKHPSASSLPPVPAREGRKSPKLPPPVPKKPAMLNTPSVDGSDHGSIKSAPAQLPNRAGSEPANFTPSNLPGSVQSTAASSPASSVVPGSVRRVLPPPQLPPARLTKAPNNKPMASLQKPASTIKVDVKVEGKLHKLPPPPPLPHNSYNYQLPKYGEIEPKPPLPPRVNSLELGPEKKVSSSNADLEETTWISGAQIRPARS